MNGVVEKELKGYLVYPVVVSAVFIGLYFSLAGRSKVHLFGDEFHSLWYLTQPYSELFRTFGKSGSGTALLLIQQAAIDIFGAGLWAYRFAAFVGAIATLLIIYPAALRLVGRVPAALTALALSANSMHIFYSRFGRTYALMVFLAVLLVCALNRAMDSDRPRALWYIILAVSVGLLPYVHLTAVAFVAGVCIAAVVTMVVRRQSRRHWYWLLGSIVIGAIICIGLYLPVWKSVRELVYSRTGEGDFSRFSALDVAALLAGNRWGGVIWLVGVPIAATWMLIKKRSAGLLMVAAVFSPAIAVLIARLYGMAYAHARYLLTALPFMLMLLAWLLVEVLRVAGLSRRMRDYMVVIVGAALVMISFMMGPLGLKHTNDGPFANTYLSMMPLPAFDVAWDETPSFYKRLAASAERVRIIEVPELLNRAVLLYRNYYLQHRKDVMIGFVGKDAESVPAGPYASIWDLKSIKGSDAKYLIVHVNVKREVTMYWRFVYGRVWPRMKDPDIESLMARHAKFAKPVSSLHHMAEELADYLGEPVYKDEHIAVFELKP